MTSPGAVYKNFLIVASRVNESYDASPGTHPCLRHRDGRARSGSSTPFRARGSSATTRGSGCRARTTAAPMPGAASRSTRARGWVFAATGSATEDFYGGFRKGNNLFANCVLALDATTGERKWHYQTVQPRHLGLRQPAGARPRDDQKRRHVARRRGAAHQDGLHLRSRSRHRQAGVSGAGTAGPALDGAWRGDVTDAAGSAQAAAAGPAVDHRSRPHRHHARSRARMRCRSSASTWSGSIFTPPTLQGTLTTPGHLGGVEWHGALVRSRPQRAVRQCQRRGRRSTSCAPSRIGRGRRRSRPGGASTSRRLHGLPRRGAEGHAAADPGAGRSDREPEGAGSDHRAGPQQHAGVQPSPPASR